MFSSVIYVLLCFVSVAKLLWFHENMDREKQCYTLDEMLELIDGLVHVHIGERELDDRLELGWELTDGLKVEGELLILGNELIDELVCWQGTQWLVSLERELIDGFRVGWDSLVLGNELTDELVCGSWYAWVVGGEFKGGLMHGEGTHC